MHVAFAAPFTRSLVNPRRVVTGEYPLSLHNLLTDIRPEFLEDIENCVLAEQNAPSVQGLRGRPILTGIVGVRNCR